MMNAQRFLEEEFVREVLRAYQLAPVPAQKADIFRLALPGRPWRHLCRCGRPLPCAYRQLSPAQCNSCRAPGKLRFNRQQLHRRYPEHPVLVRALDSGQQPCTAAITISSGFRPAQVFLLGLSLWSGRQGALEACYAGHNLSISGLQRVIGIDCPVRYKSTRRHWSRPSLDEPSEVRDR